jgi:hypothetical protein
MHNESLNAILSKINMWEVEYEGKYDWVVPLGTSHLKRGDQFQKQFVIL